VCEKRGETEKKITTNSAVTSSRPAFAVPVASRKHAPSSIASIFETVFGKGSIHAVPHSPPRLPFHILPSGHDVFTIDHYTKRDTVS